MKKLKLYLEQIENTVVMRVIEQEGITRYVSENVLVKGSINIYPNAICLRGCSKTHDHKTACHVYNNEDEAKMYLEKIIGWLDDAFLKECQPKEGDTVEVWENQENEPLKRTFLYKTKSSKILCVKLGYGDYYRNGKWFDVHAWSYMKPIRKSHYNPETKIYEYCEG